MLDMKTIRLKFILSLLLFLFIACSSPSVQKNETVKVGQAVQNYYTVTKVIDGDTFEATNGSHVVRVRIAGMDAPEYKQAYGKRATYQLRKEIKDKKVRIQMVGEGLDKYGRVLGHVFVDEQDVSLVMIKQGLATYYRPFCTEYPRYLEHYNYDPVKYVEAEKKAKEKGLGIWGAGKNILPCLYRSKNR